MPRPKDWNETKEKNVWTVLDLMRELKVSVKDLSFVIADYSVHCKGLSEVQREIKGFLYEDSKITEAV